MYSFPSVYPVLANSKSMNLSAFQPLLRFPSPRNGVDTTKMVRRFADTDYVDMNYVSAVYFVVVSIILLDWFVRGRTHYRGQQKRWEEAEVLAEGVVVR